MTPEWYEAYEARTLPRAREAEIAALPDAQFKGRNLKTVTCIACNKPRNVYPSRLWVCIAIDHYVCPWCSVFGGFAEEQDGPSLFAEEQDD